MLNLRILSILVLLLGLAAVTKASKTATFENDRKDECFNLFKEITEKEDLNPEYFTMEKRQLIVDCVRAKKTGHGDRREILYCLTNNTDDMYIPKSEPLEEYDVYGLKVALRNVYDYEVEIRRLKDGSIATFENDRKDECLNLFKEMAEKEDLKPEDFTIEKKQLIVDCVKSKKTQSDDCEAILRRLANEKTDDMYIPEMHIKMNIPKMYIPKMYIPKVSPWVKVMSKY